MNHINIEFFARILRRKNLSLILVLFLGLLISSSSHAKPFGVRFMANYQTQQVYRGAVIWPKPTAIAGPMLVFYERVFFAGPNLFYSPTNRKDQLQWRTGVTFFDDDDPPIKFGDHQEDYRNRRKSSLEAYAQVSYNFGFRNKFQIGAYLGREVKENLGLHAEVFGALPLLPFTTFQVRYSVSESQMARYIYGPEANSGSGYASLALNAVYPFVPWDGIIMANYARSWVVQGPNKHADYIRGNDETDVFSLRIFWNAY